MNTQDNLNEALTLVKDVYKAMRKKYIAENMLNDALKEEFPNVINTYVLPYSGIQIDTKMHIIKWDPSEEDSEIKLEPVCNISNKPTTVEEFQSYLINSEIDAAQATEAMNLVIQAFTK